MWWACSVGVPAAAQEPTPSSSSTVAAEPPEDVSAPIIDVTVEEEREAPGETQLTREETRRLPGALGDPFRAVGALPGVTPTVSGLPFFYVRGAPPGNVGYFLDGVRVPYLFHALGGPAVIHPRLIEEVSLYQGGYPAAYGRNAGGVLTGSLVAPSGTWRGEGSLRLIDAGVFVEGTFDEGRGSATVAGRYSYTGAIFSAISPDLTLDYRDAQARVTYDLTPDDRISIFAFGAYDFFATETESSQTRPVFATEFYRVDTRYDRWQLDGGRLRVAVTTGFDRTVTADARDARTFMVATRMRLRQPLRDTLRLDVGLEVQRDDYTITPTAFRDPDDLVATGFDDLFRDRQDGAGSAWAGLEWTPSPRILVQPGVRIDGFLQGATSSSPTVGVVTVDPRLAVSVRIHDRVRLLHAFGTAHQAPSYLVAVPGLIPSALEGGPQRALQSSAGVELKLPAATWLTVNVFNNVFLGLTDGADTDDPLALPTELPRSLGSARGLEVYLRRSLSRRLGGFLSYTLSRSTRARGRRRSVASFDRPHVLAAAFSYDLGGGWVAGSRFNVQSGTPNALRTFFAEGENVVRDRPFYRLDARAEKRWTVAERGFISLVLEVVNATFNRQVVDGELLPPVVLPSLGVEGGW
ncbi:MAG: TonB-dependent receptor plug domain-containing protein [Myxococcota bacterium]